MNLGRIASLDAIGSARPLTALATDGDTAIGMLEGVIRRGNGQLDAELFGIRERQILDAVDEQLDKPGSALRLHGDAERLADPDSWYYDAGLLVRPEVTLTTPGAYPLKTHMKLLATESEAWLGTTGPHRSPRPFPFIDFAATFGAEDAAVLRRMMRAAQAADVPEIHASAAAGLKRGFVLNDPDHGLTNGRQAVELIADGAHDSLIAGSKIADDKGIFKRLGTAADRGVSALAETTYRVEPKAMGKIERAANGRYPISVQERSPDLNMHMNFVVADEGTPDAVAYVGTGHLTRRGMANPNAKRPSRELGIVTRDPQVIDQLLSSVETIPGSRIAEMRRNTADRLRMAAQLRPQLDRTIA